MSFALFSVTASIPPQNQVCIRNTKKCHDNTKKLIKSIGIPSISTSPHESLQTGNWVKLICGASFEDVVDVRNLSLVYTLAGVDCIDCAADESVINAVNEGIQAATEILPTRRPWVMISVNDYEDLHFRKAEFDPEECPLDCSRPCESVCPANAISFEKENLTAEISSRTNTPAALKIDAFKELWNGLGDSVKYLQLVAVSLPNLGDATVPLMDKMYNAMESNLHCYNLWQLDGRPMSGDIGRGATREAISFAVSMAAANDRPPGFVQLAGGTNAHTVIGLKKEGLFQTNALTNCISSPEVSINGIAYGGYARKIVGRVLSRMEKEHGVVNIEDYPKYLHEALIEALGLVVQMQCAIVSLFLNFLAGSGMFSKPEIEV